MTKNEKKYQKKVLQLINAIKKCNIEDLKLFMALVLIRFDILDTKHDNESTLLEQCVDISTELHKNEHIYNLLK